MDNSSKELLRRQEYYRKAREMSFEKNKTNTKNEEIKTDESTVQEVNGNKKNIINI